MMRQLKAAAEWFDKVLFYHSTFIKRYDEHTLNSIYHILVKTPGFALLRNCLTC